MSVYHVMWPNDLAGNSRHHPGDFGRIDHGRDDGYRLHDSFAAKGGGYVCGHLQDAAVDDAVQLHVVAADGALE